MKNEVCPVCKSKNYVITREDLKPHPYVECSYCGLYYQQDPPNKIYESSAEKAGNLMSQADKDTNFHLATALYKNHIQKYFKNKKKLYALDLGSKFPFLSHCLQIVSDNKIKAYGIDGIKEAVKYGKELNVEMRQCNFESDPVSFKNKINLVTLIHVLEHLYAPVRTLKKIRSLMANDGILFIRCPDSQVPGIERDFDAPHYEIHPLIWNEQAFFELLYQLKDQFVCYETYPLEPGQRDYLLRPIKAKPTIAAGYIVKNEERDLPASLNSIKDIVDKICIIDTGSTDNTKEIPAQFKKQNPEFTGVNKEIHFQTYLGASKKHDNDYQLWDFSLARNQYVKWIDKSSDLVFWVDADDQVPENTAKIIKRIPYMPYDLHGFMIKCGNDSHLHHRIWRTKKGIKYHGKVHEYPCWSAGLKYRIWNDLYIIHNGDEKAGESSIHRNLRILEKEVKENPSHRNLFYLGNTHRDASGIKDLDKKTRELHLVLAVNSYSKYLSTKSDYYDEMMFAYIYKARCFRFLEDRENTLKTVQEALFVDSSFAELPMEACYVEYQKGNHKEAASWALRAMDMPYRKRLFSEKNKYTDQPLRQLTHCLYKLNQKVPALYYGKRVKEYVNDPSWERFISSLEEKTPKKVVIKDKPAKEIKFNDIKTINILRPGAIGDIILTGWALKGLKEKYPNAQIKYFTKYPSVAMMLKDVSSACDSDLWNIRKEGLDLVMTGYPIKDGYPDVPMKKHLVDYFSEEVGVKAQVPEFRSEILNYPKREKPYITLHATAGWSIYKNWFPERWVEVIDYLLKNLPKDLEIIQLGGKGDLPIQYKDTRFINLIGKTSIEEVAMLISSAKLHLGVDSFTNHLCGVFKTPSVILFGSTSPVGSGYKYADNVYLDLPCQPCYREDPKISKQPRGICEDPPGQTYENPMHRCMFENSSIYLLHRINKYIDAMNIFKV